MKKKIVLSIIVIVATCMFTGITLIAYNYYSPPKLRTASPTTISPDDTLRIAYIGDSWAFIHKKRHQCQIPSIITDSCHIPAKIDSYGLSGRTSKEIYEAIFDEKELKQMLQSHKYDYCIVSAGINDANKKMSIKYYQESMDGIIQYLLSNHIRPVILEIPDYDIQKIFRWERKNRKILRHLSMEINGIPIDCKKTYRDVLDELIRKKDYQDKVSIIRYKSWNKDYDRDLKTLYLVDGVHLNEHGNHVLDSVIATEIISLLLPKNNHN